MSAQRPAVVEVIIATLPDPLDTGLGYSFDTMLQALVLGLEAESKFAAPVSPGYLRDHAWLPWHEQTGSKADAGGPPADVDTCRREVPGAILFRSADPAKPRLLVALLVGESPITGVHPRAMRRAIELARYLELRERSLSLWAERLVHGDRGLRVVGPTFSGSAPSLRRAMDAFPEQTFRFVSGTASGRDVSRVLGANTRSEEARRTARPHTSYQATTVPESALECVFLHYALDAGAEHDPRHRGPRGLAAPVGGVAMLVESGTEFGRGGQREVRIEETPKDAACDLRPEIDLTFPFHVSAIRDAYEDLDATHPHAQVDATVARYTQLHVALRSSPRTDMEMPISATTKFAQDLALQNVLEQIEREGVRWVGIRATDVADAIFLARKIRDVAPDVRIGLFTADALLTHESFRPDLLGSLVITPYPFLGAQYFRSESPNLNQGRIFAHEHGSFPNSASEGIFNAALVVRGGSVQDLAEYAYFRGAGRAQTQPLPVWIAAVGRGELVPLRARPAVDCEGTIFGADPAAARELCADRPSPHAWQAFNQLRNLQLHLDPDSMPPRMWHFAFALLLLGFVLHEALVHRRHLGELDHSVFPEHKTPDTKLDRCIVRTKWRLYAAFARIVLTIALLYLSAFYVVAFIVYGEHDNGAALLVPPLLAFVALLIFGWRVREALVELGRDVAQFRGFLRRHKVLKEDDGPAFALPGKSRRWAVLGLLAGMEARVHPGHEHEQLLYISYAQVRCLAALGVVFALAFSIVLALEVGAATDAALEQGVIASAMTLYALRNLSMTNGVSTAIPILLGLASAYVWAVGRMQRLRLLHGLSWSTDQDCVCDGVSTPIRSIMFPDTVRNEPDSSGDRVEPGDHGLTRVERRLVNVVLRPSGRAYFASLGVIALVPAVLYLLKRPTTLETVVGTWVLYGTLAVCAALTWATIVQLFLYRSALRELLDRVMSHELGASFRYVATPTRLGVDVQITSSHGLKVLLAACEHAFRRLVGSTDLDSAQWRALERFEQPLAVSRKRALSQPPLPSDSPRATPPRPQDGQAPVPPPTVELAVRLVSAAREVMKMLQVEWSRCPPPIAWTLLQDADNRDPPTNATGWVRNAETFVATVVALLINRHICQFKYFLGVTSGCSILLVLAVANYPFEPHRLMMTGLWILVLTVVSSSVWVYVELDRSPLLRFIGGKTPRAAPLAFSWELTRRVVLWAGVPLLFIFGSQYPDVANQLFKLLEPFHLALR